MKNIKKILTILIVLFILAIAVNAQPGSTGAGGFDDEPQDVPLDGGILLLAALGAAYGYKKMKER